MEESIAKNSFKGHLDLDVLLYLHLRVIDTGLIEKVKADMNSPSNSSGNREEAILTYIDEKIKEETDYALKLSKEFQKSVECFCKNLPRWDKKTSLVGDVLILDRDRSIEFFLILYRLKFESYSKNDKEKVLKLWERLLFTYDFHDRFRRVWNYNREKFPKLFVDCIENKTFRVDILERYVKEGFNKERVENNLQGVSRKYITNKEKSIKNNAFKNYSELGGLKWDNKLRYILYKFEKHQGVGLKTLREIMRVGSSLDHILPQEWYWEWIGAKQDKLTSKDKTFNTKIDKRINGIGNLILVSSNDNSSKSNTHPAEYEYKIKGGSYQTHNDNRKNWKNHENWASIIDERSEAIYDFLINTMLLPLKEPLECEEK